jgi:hypothetical protein
MKTIFNQTNIQIITINQIITDLDQLITIIIMIEIILITILQI